ncbi:hypothetical protein AB9F41_33800, partial [Rhizobium leguminosarum]
LAEFMNFPGVIHKDPVFMAKLDAFQGGHIDVHAPLLSGNDLNGYLAAGIRTEHECTTAAEAMEKIRKGMQTGSLWITPGKFMNSASPMNFGWWRKGR